MRGGVEGRMLLNLAISEGEHYAQQARDTIVSRVIDKDDEKNRLYLVFNLLKKLRNRKIGRLWSIANEFHATPSLTDARALDKASVVNKLIKGLNRKLKERQQQWRRLSWLVDCGSCVEHIPWVEDAVEEPIPAYDPETNELLWRDAADPRPESVLPQSVVEQMVQQGVSPERFSIVEHLQLVGDVDSQVLSPLNFFIDDSVPTIAELGADQMCYVAEVKTVSFVEDVFGKEYADRIQANVGTDLGIIKTRLLDKGPSVANMNMRDLIPAIQGSRGPDDPPMCIVITGYAPPGRRNPHGRRAIFVPGQIMLDDGDIPYGEIPLVDFHYEAPTKSFWTGDFLTDKIAPQKFLNKRLSQLGEAANSQLYEVLLLGGELTKADIPADMPGIVEDGLDETGNPRVAVLNRGQLPTFFVESIKLVVELLQSMGSSDLTDHKQFPGQIRGPMALPMLQEILDSEDGPLYDHLGEQLALVHQQRVNRVKQFYPGVRTLHYTGRSRKDEVLVFHTDEILRSGTDFSIVVEPGSLLPEFTALKEARIIERLQGPLAGLYVNKRTGKIDYSRVARELRYTEDETQDRDTQYRDLAQQLISRLWQGETLPEEVPYPFWDHDVMMDELEATMATTEFLEASQQTKQNFIGLYERHRQYLAAIQESQMQAVQGQMMQGALAQATQQVAARTAAETTDAALGQIRAQASQAQANPPVQQVAAAFSKTAQQGAQGRMAQGPSRPQ